MRSLTQVLLLAALCFLACNEAWASGFELILRDDFDGPFHERLDGTKWVYGVGYGNSLWGNNEYQTYTHQIDNFRQDGQGHLVITARREPDGRFTYGRIKTKGRFALKFGINDALPQNMVVDWVKVSAYAP